MPHETHEFTLILSGVSESTEEMANAVYEAGCDDASLASREGVVFLGFDREAPSFRDAVLSAIRDVRMAGYQVARVEPDDFVTAAEIARRLGRTRESVRQHILGVRGPGGFPAPVASLTGRSPLWRWAEVADWFSRRTPNQPPAPDQAPQRLIAVLNDVLDLLRHARSESEVRELYRALGGRGKRAARARAPAAEKTPRKEDPSVPRHR
jgi:hypothetical protein